MSKLSSARASMSRYRRPTLSLESLETRALLAAAPFSSIPDLAAASDSGSSAIDNKTNVVTPIFTGTARNASSVKIFVGGSEAGTAPVVSGRWSFTHPGLPDGRYSITARPVGEGGTPGRSTAALPIEIRTAAPAAPSLGIVQPGVSPSVSGSAATNLGRPTFTGVGPRGGSVQVLVDDVAVGQAAVRDGNRFTLRPATALANGDRAVKAVAIDLFGNRSAPATLALKIDTTPPTIEGVVRLSVNTIAARFSEPIKGISPGSFRFAGRTAEGFAISSRPLTDAQLRSFVGNIGGQLSPDGRTYLIVAPKLDLAAGNFTLTLPKAAVTDLAGNRLANGGTLSVAVQG